MNYKVYFQKTEFDIEADEIQMNKIKKEATIYKDGKMVFFVSGEFAIDFIEEKQTFAKGSYPDGGVKFDLNDVREFIIQPRMKNPHKEFADAIEKVKEIYSTVKQITVINQIEKAIKNIEELSKQLDKNK